ELSERTGTRRPLRPGTAAGGGPPRDSRGIRRGGNGGVRGGRVPPGALRDRVVPRPPCRQAGPTVRRRELRRPVGDHEPPRRGPGPGRAGRRPRTGAVPGGGGRDRQRPALPAAPATAAGRAAARPAGGDGGVV